MVEPWKEKRLVIMPMSSSQKNKCHMIIHAAAASAAAGSAVPVPGMGIAADLGALTGMVIGLANVFDCSLKEMAALLGKKVGSETASKVAAQGVKEVAKRLAKEFLKEEGGKAAVSEFTKYVPLVGQVVSAGLAAKAIENIGWKLASELYDTHTSMLRKLWNWARN